MYLVARRADGDIADAAADGFFNIFDIIARLDWGRSSHLRTPEISQPQPGIVVKTGFASSTTAVNGNSSVFWPWISYCTQTGISFM